MLKNVLLKHHETSEAPTGKPGKRHLWKPLALRWASWCFFVAQFTVFFPGAPATRLGSPCTLEHAIRIIKKRTASSGKINCQRKICPAKIGSSQNWLQLTTIIAANPSCQLFLSKRLVEFFGMFSSQLHSALGAQNEQDCMVLPLCSTLAFCPGVCKPCIAVLKFRRWTYFGLLFKLRPKAESSLLLIIIEVCEN